MPKAGAGRKESRADGVSVRIHTPTIISIYVPTWGTTSAATIDSLISSFQSTSPRGGRRYSSNLPSRKIYFNPRPHVGDDFRWVRHAEIQVFQSTSPRRGRRVWLEVFRFEVISIHVPTWGTTRSVPNSGTLPYFNPRPHVGDDSAVQSVFHRYVYFNPRPCMRDDAKFGERSCNNYSISINSTPLGRFSVLTETS